MPSRRRKDTVSPRWRGQSGRLEVWYATVSDPLNRTGCWVHHEVVSPVVGEPYVHGWAAIFAAGERPALERFGPVPATGVESSSRLPAPEGFAIGTSDVAGRAGALGWSISFGDSGGRRNGDPPKRARTLFTFPEWAWERELLPAAQVVCVPSSRITGTLERDGRSLELSAEARGNLAHIYGHGSAEQWGWLHAELGGGDVLEVVSAVSRRPGLSRLPPLAFVQLRLGGEDWPRDPLATSTLFRTRLALPTWSVAGSVGRFRLRARVTIEDSRAVRVGYVDPDGSTATCTNSEIADAQIVLDERAGGEWRTRHSWSLVGTAHSEVGTRP